MTVEMVAWQFDDRDDDGSSGGGGGGDNTLLGSEERTHAMHVAANGEYENRAHSQW